MTGIAVLQWPYALLGAAVGLLVGMTGVGGGSLMTPALILLFGVHPTLAVGTDLLFAAVTKSVGTCLNGFSHAVDWAMVATLAAGSLPASAASLYLLSKVDLQSNAMNDGIRLALVVALLIGAAFLLARPWLERIVRAHGRGPEPRPYALTMLTGLVVGVAEIGRAHV